MKFFRELDQNSGNLMKFEKDIDQKYLQELGDHGILIIDLI